MKRKRLILKAALWSAVATTAYFPVSLITTFHLYHHKDHDIEVYVQENLEQIIQKQEEKIGINYPAERPKIEYVFPEKDIDFGVMGIYNETRDTLYLPSGLLTKPEWDFNDFIATVATFNGTYEVKKVIDHELAHFYCDKIQEQSLGNSSHLFQRNLFLPEERIANLLVNEGIAKYIEDKMNSNDQKIFPFEEWPSTLEQFSNKEIYLGGYTIVKPIIDKYGKKGIKFLLFNHPTPKETFRPSEYQQRILDEIARLEH